MSKPVSNLTKIPLPGSEEPALRTRTIAALSLLAVCGLVAETPAAAERQTGGTTALVNVRVVSMNPADRKVVRKRQTVIVQDGRITEIGKAKKVDVPADAEVVNGRNKLYVLPGLADMHVHNRAIPTLPEKMTAEEVYSLYFANGVTTLLDMAGFDGAMEWKKSIRQGKVVGPDLHFTTPLIDEEDYRSLEDLESDMRSWERQGHTYIKSHAIQSAAFFERVHDLARELSLPVIGHALRPGFPIQDTLAQEPLMIAHIEEILSTSVDDFSDFETQLETPLRDVANSRVWVTGTVNVYEMIANTVDDDAFATLLSRPEMIYMPPSARMVWEFQNRYRGPDFAGTDRAFWMSQLDVMLYIARRLSELGALDRLLLGTDAAGPANVLPGFSLHDELRLLVEAGLTPWEAILTGTYNPAVFFDTINEVGTVEEGKRADLLVANKNPLKKIGRLRDLAGVMVNGVWLSEKELDARLDELAARWAKAESELALAGYAVPAVKRVAQCG